MGKSKYSDKEFTKEQRLLKENRQLKQELGHLRKQIARLDNGRFETLRQMVIEQEESQRFQENMPKSNIEELKKEWACKKENCNGFLEIVLFSKLGQTHYYRSCNSCSHRTPGKRYDNEVKGIVKK